MQKDNIWVYDWETLKNCITYTAVNLDDEKDVLAFVIHESRNDIGALWDHLNSPGLKQIGYNNISFDYPICHMLLLKPRSHWVNMGAANVIAAIYGKAQEIISAQANPFVPKKWLNQIIPQRDLMKIWHFDNIAKFTSLKWLQCTLRWPVIEEMPFHHDHHVLEHEIPGVLHYNLNDVLATRFFFLHEKNRAKLNMRWSLGDKYHLNFMNDNDTKIGEKILIHKVAERKGMDPYSLKELRTSRPKIKITDCLLPYIRFTTPVFQKLYDNYKALTITKTKGEVEFKVIYDGMEYAFATGGLHAARANSIFHDIDSADVSSYYPNLGIKNRFYPEHLGEDFCDVYEEIYHERKKYAKKTPENEGLKLALNGSYGKSNSNYSALYDPKYTMQITLNGQLLLAMLCEWITERKAGRIIMVNTDGIEVSVTNHKEYEACCAEWQALTKLELEKEKYRIIALRDVNNYIAITLSGKTKEKGAYEIDKDLHKDPSMRIVPLAVREAFVNGVKPRDFIYNHEDMWDFFLYSRAKTGKLHMSGVDPEGDVFQHVLPKTIRYYMSPIGIVLGTRTDKKAGRLHKGVYQTVINDVNPQTLEIMRGLLNRNFYVGEANKLLLNVGNVQTQKNVSLFETV